MSAARMARRNAPVAHVGYLPSGTPLAFARCIPLAKQPPTNPSTFFPALQEPRPTRCLCAAETPAKGQRRRRPVARCWGNKTWTTILRQREGTPPWFRARCLSLLQASPVAEGECAPGLKKAGDRCQASQREVPNGTGPPLERAQDQLCRRTHRGSGHEWCLYHSWTRRQRGQAGHQSPAIRTPDETADAPAGATGSTRDLSV